jgi:hypothetical protein
MQAEAKLVETMIVGNTVNYSRNNVTSDKLF